MTSCVFQCATALLLVAVLFMSSVPSTQAQIHWNRGWGAGGSLGKRSPSSDLHRQLLSRMWLNSPVPQYGDSNVMQAPHPRYLSEGSLESTEKATGLERAAGPSNGAVLPLQQDPSLASDDDCNVDTPTISTLVSKLIEEEAARVVQCARQRTASWGEEASIIRD